ncbi:putative gliotoxin efflux pump [Hypoxylon sp. FL1150]|nr:putative gliotoxin efflux pump [Hypoxylon sp. FL1150]
MARPRPLRSTAIVVALVLSIFLASLDTSIITTAISSITNEFHSLQDVGSYGSAIFFPLATTQSVWGKAYKYLPVKLDFLLGTLIFQVGSETLAPNSSASSAGRAVTDTGCAGTFAGLGLLTGGAFTQNMTWRWCFYVNLPFGGIAAVAILLTFRAPKSASPTLATVKEKFLQMDIPGAVLICAAIVCLTPALQWAGAEKALGDSDVVGTMLATPIYLVLFGIDQWLQGERALIMPSFLRNRVLLVGAVFKFFIAGCFNLALYWLPIYFQAVRGVTAFYSGIRLIPVILSLTIAQIAVGAVGSGLLMLVDEQFNAGQWIGFQIILRIGVGLCLTIPLMLSQVAVTAKEVSTATPIIIFTQSMSSAFILSTAQAVFQNEPLKALRQLVPDIDPLAVLSAGANSEAISNFLRASQGGILQSYDSALRPTFGIGIPFAGVALLVSFFMSWWRYHDASKKTPPETEMNHAENVAQWRGTKVIARCTTFLSPAPLPSPLLRSEYRQLPPPAPDAGTRPAVAATSGLRS